MTVQFPGCRLTAHDHRLCRSMMDGIQRPAPAILSLLREKLASARVVATDEIHPLVATLNSRVAFGIDNGPAQTRILVGCPFRNGLVGLTLPVSTLYGLALLGLREGQSVEVGDGGERRRVTLHRVLYQPEAARHRRQAPAIVTSAPGGAAAIDLARIRAERASRPAAGRDLPKSKLSNP